MMLRGNKPNYTLSSFEEADGLLVKSRGRFEMKIRRALTEAQISCCERQLCSCRATTLWSKRHFGRLLLRLLLPTGKHTL